MELIHWVPPSVLSGILAVLGGLLWRAFTHISETVLKDLHEMKKSLDEISKELGKSASVEQLGRLGDRFDARLAVIHESIGQVRERVAALEGPTKDHRHDHG